jgi:hypothetical protein
MADQNIEAQRFAELLANANQELARNGAVSSETQNALTDASVKAKNGIQNFTKGTAAAAGVLTGLAGAGLAASKAMYDGQKGAAALNSSLDGLSTAATAAGVALALMMPGGLIVKGVIAGFTAITAATIGYTKLANNMADSLYKGYSGLAKSGASAADGMSGVADNAQKMGLNLNNLDSMIGLVAANSEDLAAFSGTVGAGTTKLANMSKALESSRTEFYRLGMSQEDVNEGLANYLRIQARTGVSQKQTTDQLAASARNYIYEQDTLAKVTGLNAKKQQEIREAALNEEQFLAKIRKMRRENDNEGANALENFNIMMTAMGEDIGRGYRARVNMNLRDDAARKLNFTMQGREAEIIEKVARRQITEAQGAQMMAEGMKEYADGMGGALGELGVGEQYGVKLSSATKAAAMGQNDFAASVEAANKTQAAQKAGEDKKTAQMADLIKSQQDVMLAMQKTVYQGIEEALGVAKALTGVTSELEKAFTKMAEALKTLVPLLEKFAVGVAGTITKTVEVVDATQKAGMGGFYRAGGSEMVGSGVGALAGGAKGAAVGAAVGSVVPVAGTAIGAILGGIVGGTAGYFGGKALGMGADAVGTAITPPGRAEGGPVSKGNPYLVGEKGPEMFVPDTSGDIVPLNGLAGSGAGKRQSVEIANAIKNIISDTFILEKITDADTKRAEKYTVHYKNYIELKTKFENKQMEFMNYQLTEGFGTPSGPTGMGGGSGQGGGTGLRMPTASGMTSQGGGTGLKADQNSLKNMGLNIKEGDVQAADAGINSKLIELAKSVQSGVPGFGYFSAFNDKFHQEKAPSSQHAKGLAMDFTVKQPPSKEDGKAITDWLRSMGASLAIDEYNNPSSNATAGHFHAQIPELETGGIASGPDAGYLATLHGDEAVIPLNNSGGNFVQLFEQMAMMMGQQAGALEELVRIAKSGNDISTKILRSAN